MLVGVLGNQQQIENKYGAENVRVWSNPDNASPGVATNVNSLQQAMNVADSYLESMFFTQGNYAVPPGAGQNSMGIVTDWWVTIAAWSLYTARGLRDSGKNNAMQAEYKRVVAAIQFYASGSGANRLQLGYRWPVADTPTVY